MMGERDTDNLLHLDILFLFHLPRMPVRYRKSTDDPRLIEGVHSNLYLSGIYLSISALDIH